MSQRHRAGALIAALALGASLGACGSDADSTDTKAPATAAAAPTTVAAPATSPPSSTAAGGTDTFCDAVFAAQTAINTGDPAAIAPALELTASSAPAELAADVAVMVDAGRNLDEHGPPPEFYESSSNVAEWVGDHCDAATFAVQAGEYQFAGFPSTAEAGPVVITFANQGKEQHEMSLVRINDGVTESVHDLLMMPEEEVDTMITFVGGTFAEPGQSVATFAELTPGRYVAVCFVPVGSTPEAVATASAAGGEVEGQPHAMVGMTAELTVT